ncbi:PilT/PilU family type 4a pilus ATPase [Plasticicumulans sp.]|uniref:PilT/PilU family type 4a pilus ATPase n=1 Tax=Plasticicumulans sp. TaxID=2307179 RepID=UPI002BA13B07|nr:PilT/PilU family type 4a pilus ATPase [Plasticicumulans sp.]MBS0601861.1 PilT/PilU family type 4a pilus ATPase [Pseudomonadota bacterium]HMV37686.1 PilT/PilU family type 4a pilus ATPase [Plasticicumulans sp.]HMW28883.1 PilT/PilU family type 4a pilus ATPase [Plasticicumulans sp.]HMW41038.1 PilT/PilU family type 4a pilus ATPase [Plasticicumulans sp.]HMX53063.1 PilT/PilU family type 4a pilus ATPase [Plasticicumulans sp.]
MDVTPYLKLMVDREASDLFFYVGAPVNIKIEGTVMPLGNVPLKPGAVREIAYSLMTDSQIREFERDLESNFALSVSEIGRFRANVFRQRGEVSMVIRYIKQRIPDFVELSLPQILGNLVMEKRGLVLMVGSTGSGKSTSLAAMIDHRNSNAAGHILTIEDPIEFVHHHKKSVIGQREIGIDTHSYGDALKNALREAPDVILIGEVRDAETMKYSISYAETGHLCLSTLHANHANGALERIINFFPEIARPQLLMDLSQNLRAIVSQRLIIGVDGRRVPAVEIMLNTPYISELILKGKFESIKEAMAQGTEIGMKTFDQALYDLYKGGRISKDEAVRNADSRNNVSLQIRLSEGMGQGKAAPDPLGASLKVTPKDVR